MFTDRTNHRNKFNNYRSDGNSGCRPLQKDTYYRKLKSDKCYVCGKDGCRQYKQTQKEREKAKKKISAQYFAGLEHEDDTDDDEFGTSKIRDEYDDENDENEHSNPHSTHFDTVYETVNGKEVVQKPL